MEGLNACELLIKQAAELELYRALELLKESETLEELEAKLRERLSK